MDPDESSAQRELALTVPPNQVLRKSLTFPLATEENLRQVLEFQIEQHTPFTSNQVYFGYSVLARNFEHGQLTVELIATPRNAVDAAIKTLGDAGLSVYAVFPADRLAAASLVNLLPAAVGKKSFPFRLGANPWLAVLAVALALAAMAMPPVIKREAVVQMLPWVEKAKAVAETVDGLRRELEVRVEHHNYLLQKRQTTPTVIQSLEELTRILPDGTWVQSLEMRGKEIQIQGETNASVKLIGLFEQSSIFGDASFRSPLTKVNNSSNERYHLAIQMRPEAVTVPAAGAASAPVVAQQSPNPPASSPSAPVSSASTPASSSSAPVSSASTPASTPPPVLVSSAPAQKASENKNTPPKEGSKP
jgi:general secretion pathway protein L